MQEINWIDFMFGWTVLRDLFEVLHIDIMVYKIYDLELLVVYT